MAGESNGALMRRRFRGPMAARFIFVLLVFVLAGCFPQTLVTQPGLTLHIQNQSGEAVAAQVTLYWWEYPHRRQRAVVEAATGVQGAVTFTETTASEIMMPLMPHGVPAYNWTFCVEAASYKTLIGTVRNVAPGESIAISLTLPSGDSLPVCTNFDRLSSHPGSPAIDVTSSGGDVHGIYVVDEVNDR